MSTLYLQSSEFYMSDNKQYLCTRIKGIAIVLFFTSSCTFCAPYIELFKQLKSVVPGCQPAIINLDHGDNMMCATASQSTKFPLTYVPYIVLYYDGVPCAVYDGDANIGAVGAFITNTLNSLEQKQQFSKPEQDKIPEFLKGVGVPKRSSGSKRCKDGVCYISYEKAYATEPPQ